MSKKRDHKVSSEGLTIITSHVNADFDAMASMLAAQKLYPEALVVFPGSQERNLRNFFIQSMVYLYNIVDLKSIDIHAVKKLVLVDTRQVGRIGKIAEALKNKDLTVHTYDHHPVKPDDIHAHYEVHSLTGATVTMFTEIIIKKKIELTAEEATIMCLGIYEDTGSFTFTSTTGRDLNAAAFLLSKGANLNIISSLISREISPEQVGHLNELLKRAQTHNINGMEVVVTTLALDEYLPDFAFLVHKMIRMKNINAVFALALMENKVYLVARSRTEEVDAGAIVSHLGGGGHLYAAAATIKGKTLHQVEQELFKILYDEVKSKRQARHLMSSPAIMVNSMVSCHHARKMLTRYNVNALLISKPDEDKERLVGYISRQVVEKAIYHKLGDVPVKEYMTTEMQSAGPEADIMDIQTIIIENKQRIVPILENDNIIGVITRTDLLNILVQQNQLIRSNGIDPTKETTHVRTRNVYNFMQERLPPRILSIFEELGRAAEAFGCGVYVIGGFVRDLFLYRANDDLDIVVEGDGIAFAKKYAKSVGARLHSHRKFNTAVIVLPDGLKIDVASARMEYYAFPAALPDVELSSIKLDLFRRDFTINTLAIQLNPGRFGRLIDFFSAQKDIKDKAIRVLHNLSFVEDPTRVFRAIRFEQRFGFTIGKLTASLIENAVKMDFFKRLSGRRVFSELRHILQEEDPVPALIRLQDFRLLSVIHNSVHLNKSTMGQLNAVKEVLAWHDLLFLEEPIESWAVYFMGLIRPCDKAVSEEICRRLEMPQRFEKLFCADRFESESCLNWLEQHQDIDNSTLYQRLSHFKPELILYMMAGAAAKTTQKTISRYYTHLRNIDVSINGEDIKKMGIPPGPIYRRVLSAVLAAKLNGRVATREQELEFARNFIQQA